MQGSRLDPFDSRCTEVVSFLIECLFIVTLLVFFELFFDIITAEPIFEG